MPRFSNTDAVCPYMQIETECQRNSYGVASHDQSTAPLSYGVCMCVHAHACVSLWVCVRLDETPQQSLAAHNSSHFTSDVSTFEVGSTSVVGGFDKIVKLKKKMFAQRVCSSLNKLYLFSPREMFVSV